MPLIFISHAAVDSEIAKSFQADIKKDFLGMCEIFVSSNLDSIEGGAEWSQKIKASLENCAVLVGLLSPVALSRPWIYAEFGAGWIRGVPTIPVCHSGVERSQLPAPLSFFQGLNLSDEDHLEHLYSIIATTIGCQKPHVGFRERAVAYFQLTERLRNERVVVSWAKQLFIWNPLLRDKLKSGDRVSDIFVPAHLDQPFREFVSEVNSRQYLDIQGMGFAMGTPVAAQASVFSAQAGAHFSEFLQMVSE